MGVIENINEYAPFCNYLVIDDGSTDNMAEICESNGIMMLTLPKNLGIGGAMQSGYKYAHDNGYDVAVQVDGDGQHDAHYVRAMIDEIESGGADLVIGSRYINKEGFQSSFMRRLGIIYFSKLIKILTKVRVTDPTSGFRACNRRVIEQFSERYPKRYPEPEVLITVIKKGLKVSEISVIMDKRRAGKSSITAPRAVFYMFRVTLGILNERFK